MSTEGVREGERGRQYSTSPGLSSPPPKSPDSPGNNNSIRVAAPSALLSYPDLANHDGAGNNNEGGGNSNPGLATITLDAKIPTAASTATATAPVVKRTRKKREPAANVSGTGPEMKEKKTRKPRATSGTSIPARKKIKSEPVAEPQSVALSASRQTKTTDLVPPPQPPPQPPYIPNPHANGTLSQSGKHEAIVNEPVAAPMSNQSTPRSGQNYDPIRSSTVEPPKQYTNPFGPPQPSPLKSANRASASPSISSLIDPPNPSPVNYPFSQLSNPSNMSNSNSPHEYHPSPRPHLSPPVYMHGDIQSRPSMTSNATSAPNMLSIQPPAEHRFPALSEATAMDIDSVAPVKPALQTARKPSTGTSTGPHSASHSPKPSRPKEKDILPPLPGGNGLLSSTLFGGISAPIAEKEAPTVILHVPLNGEVNKYVNFARMAEEQYGFNALHPRLAAQRERLARVAAAGALLEKASSGAGGQSGRGMAAFEMRVELWDGEGMDSNVEMGGGGAGEKGKAGETPGLKPVRKRRMKEDQYDKEDPFVDDSELVWEEQAAASKDGFFVYSGPLVPEGEKPQVERYVRCPHRFCLHVPLLFICLNFHLPFRIQILLSFRSLPYRETLPNMSPSERTAPSNAAAAEAVEGVAPPRADPAPAGEEPAAAAPRGREETLRHASPASRKQRVH